MGSKSEEQEGYDYYYYYYSSASKTTRGKRSGGHVRYTSLRDSHRRENGKNDFRPEPLFEKFPFIMFCQDVNFSCAKTYGVHVWAGLLWEKTVQKLEWLFSSKKCTTPGVMFSNTYATRYYNHPPALNNYCHS